MTNDDAQDFFARCRREAEAKRAGVPSDEGLIKALEEVKERCFKAGGEANWAHDILSIVVPALESPTLSRHKAPLSGPTAWTSTMGQDPATDMAERLHNAVPLSVAGDDAERVARAWLEASGCRWCDLSPLQKTNHLGYAHAAIAALQARPSVAGDEVERVIRDLAKQLYAHHVIKYDPEAEERCIRAALTALQVTEGDKLP